MLIKNINAGACDYSVYETKELKFLRRITTENALRAANAEASSAWKGEFISARKYINFERKKIRKEP